jgi:hypothetical protein
MTNTATEECSLENAVDIQTAFFLANFDAARAGCTPQALQAAQQELDSVHARVPQACTDEMVASASDASLSQYCSPANSTAWATAMQSAWQAGENYVATGNREAFISAVRTIIDQCLRSVPRQCWFVPLPQPATPPLQQFHPQVQQLINNVNTIARQGRENFMLKLGNIR